MDEIILLGLNHVTAPIELRECLAFTSPETDNALETLRRCPGVHEVMLFSTCNRVEVLLTSSDRPATVDAVKRFLAEFKAVPLDRFDGALYERCGDEAVRHIFRVAASLDSMVLGEPQILGQIKAAYLAATLKKTTGVILNRLLHRAFFVAKRIRSETGIGDHAVSISYAAIELGRKIFGRLAGKKVLLIGAGEMAELAVEHLICHRAGEIRVANRTFERGLTLARRFKGQAVRFEEIPQALEIVDIVISSTGSPDYVIRKSQFKNMMRRRRNRPIFLIDIAVPRDIDPALNRVDNVYVYDIDDLQHVISENIEDRRREAVKGERIVDESVVRFREWYESLAVVPTIKGLHRKLEAISGRELQKTLQALPHLAPSDAEAMQRMLEAVIKKILHDPTLYLKRQGCRSDRTVYLDAARKLFKLDE